MLQQLGVKMWILAAWRACCAEEMQRLHRIKFKFMPDSQPFSLAANIAANLQVHPASEVLAGPVLLYDLDPDTAQSVVDCLTLDAVRVTHQAKVLDERCTDRDTSYDSPMKFEEIPDSWRVAWSKALHPGGVEEALAAATKLGLALPMPNPFIPEDLQQKVLPEPNPPLPVRLKPGSPVVSYVFHRQDDQFLQPKALFLCVLRSPFLATDALAMLRAYVWAHLVQEALSEYAYDAEIASCSYHLEAADGGIILMAGGFHDKLGVLIQAVARKMLEIGTSSLDSVPENFYRIVVDRLGDALRNQAYHSQPLQQASQRFSELTKRGGNFPPEPAMALSALSATALLSTGFLAPSAPSGSASLRGAKAAVVAATLVAAGRLRKGVARKAEEFAGGLIGGESAFAGQDFNFDPLGLSVKCEKFLPWFREAELKHGRIAMLAWVGLVVPEFVRVPGPEACYGAKNVVEAHNACAGDPYFPFIIDATDFYGKDGHQVGPLFQVFAFCGAVEMLTTFAKTANVSNKPGLTLANAGDYRLGANFLPEDEAKAKEMKLKELKNGRLAMLAFGGAITQATLTGNGFPWLYAQKETAGRSFTPAAHGFAGASGAKTAPKTARRADGGYKMSPAVPFLPMSPALEGIPGEE
ncbi:unnamed protein product, partial [Effrenium voratum]